MLAAPGVRDTSLAMPARDGSRNRVGAAEIDNEAEPGDDQPMKAILRRGGIDGNLPADGKLEAEQYRCPLEGQMLVPYSFSRDDALAACSMPTSRRRLATSGPSDVITLQSAAAVSAMSQATAVSAPPPLPRCRSRSHAGVRAGVAVLETHRCRVPFETGKPQLDRLANMTASGRRDAIPPM